MRPDTKNAILGGIAATIVMTLMAMFVAPMMTGMPMDIAAMIAGMMGAGYAIGMVIHLMMGIVIFPLLYVFVVYERLPGSPLVRGLIWGVLLWVVAIVVVMPMAGAGFLMANIGGMMAVMASLIAHLFYGGILGAIAGNGQDPREKSLRHDVSGGFVVGKPGLSGVVFEILWITRREIILMFRPASATVCQFG